MQYRKNGFTLIELVTVITIIAILGTIGFISYSNYLTTARDSNRIAQLTRIADALQTYSTRDRLPLPENSVSITSRGNTIAYQGDLGQQVLQAIGYSTSARDPRDDTAFTYMLTANRSDFQLLALMEDASSLQSRKGVVSQLYASNAERYPKTYGARLGVLTDMSNTPIQRIAVPDNILDVATTTLPVRSFLSDTEFISNNPAALRRLSQVIPQRGRFWEVIDNQFVVKCIHADDIVVGGYRIAPCNVGATVVGDNHMDINNVGMFFQWGEKIAWDATGGRLEANNCTWDRDTQSCTSPSLAGWSSTVSDTQSGGSDRWYAWGDTRGPCPSGYRVPSIADWQAIIDAGGWSADGNAMKEALFLPYSVFRRSSDGVQLNSGNVGYYSTSTPVTTSVRQLSVSSAGTMIFAQSRTFGIPVRCIRN